MLMMRKQVKMMGSAISESISQEKMRELENKEKEMTDFVTNVKTEKKAIQQEVGSLEGEVNRNVKLLESKKSDLEKQIAD